ncbi:MAG TPA: GNAT family N-acetyltransferase [Pedobacter sp.]|jgi:ribosomal protein S18 acetylase RimI-like enzyme
MAVIRFASKNDIFLISKLAYEIWPKTYLNILSTKQINFMLNDMYSHENLLAQFNNGVEFLMVEIQNNGVGFASYSLSDSGTSVYKIHKLYLLPAYQGKGLGNQIIQFIEGDSGLKNGKFLELNVNRNNPAVAFYLKNGFEIIREINIPYHQFTLNDYVMRKAVKAS